MTTTLTLQISAPEHLQATVDVWLAALRLLPTDPRALAALMKSDTPLPNSIRYLLGELFSPGRPPLIDVQVVPKQTKALAKAIDKLTVSLDGAGPFVHDPLDSVSAAAALGEARCRHYRTR